MSTAVGLSVSFDLLKNQSVSSMLCGESVLALVARWCAGKRLLFSLSLDRSQGRHDISCIGSSEKDCPHCVARVPSTFAKLFECSVCDRECEMFTHLSH